MEKLILKPRRFTFTVIMLLLTFVGLTSCSDDDPYYDSPILGGWYLVDSPGAIYNEFEFYPDGTGNYYAEDGYGDEFIEWEIIGNQLSIYFPSETWNFTWILQGGYLYLYPYGGGAVMIYAPF